MTTKGHWGISATLLAVAIVTVVVLPPRPVPEQYSFMASILGFTYNNWGGFRESFTQTVEQTRDRYAERLAAQPHGAADVRASHGPLALRSALESITVVRDPDVPADIAREWLRAAERDLSVFPRAAAGGVPVIVGLHTTNLFGRRGPPRSTTEGARFVYGQGREAVCIADVRLPGRDTSLASRRYWHPLPNGWWDDRGIGRCALYARYGVPGADVRLWFGLPTAWQWAYDGGLRANLIRLDAPPRPAPEEVRRQPSLLACLNSGVECDKLFRLSKDRPPQGWYYQEREAMLIADLLKHRGPDRFARFWVSSLPVDSALQEVYGVSGGNLGREVWLRRLTPPPPAGAHRGAAATSAVWLVGLLGLAMLLSRRQTMGL